MSIYSVDDLKRFYKSTTTDDEWLYAEAVPASVEFVGVRTGREWVEVTAATTATARSYAPECGSDTLVIHDAASITSVVENGVTLTAGTDYVALPANNLSPSGAWRPTSELVRYGQSWYTDGPKSTVVVTAKWGWSTLPSGLKYALLVCGKAHLQERDVTLGIVGMSESGAAGARDAKVVKDFIAAHRGPRAVMVA